MPSLAPTICRSGQPVMAIPFVRFQIAVKSVKSRMCSHISISTYGEWLHCSLIPSVMSKIAVKIGESHREMSCDSSRPELHTFISAVVCLRSDFSPVIRLTQYLLRLRRKRTPKADHGGVMVGDAFDRWASLPGLTIVSGCPDLVCCLF